MSKEAEYIELKDSCIKSAVSALHELACRYGHNAAIGAIVDWQEEYTESSHIDLISKLSESLELREIPKVG